MPKETGRALDSRQLSLFDNLRADAAEVAPAGAPARRVLLGGHPVAWELRRARRRTIGFMIDHRGLRVSAPRWVTLSEIERALVEKADWVLRKLAEWREHAARRERLAPRWEDGAPLRLLGRTLTMRIDARVGGVALAGEELLVGLPAGAGPEQFRDIVQSWLQQRAREVFAERIPVFSERLGRAPARWTISSARTRWGSCSADGSIRLNWRLVHFPLEIVDYVIAHELAHLREMNHSPRFWSTVGSLFPEFERARDWLKRIPDPERGEPK
ncbi:MAG: hypothetical protein ABS55_05880 [Lautropia sp. SCN 70-15]|nr:MAG: hypothetical protein ABS55_05880 [Lautropia sp. SCN 70-15]